MLRQPAQYLYVAALAVVAVLAWLLYAPQFNMWYGSDQAVHVLMANDFRWPQDLYYWGQNRLGSLVPMLGYALHWLGIPTIWAVGLAKFALLLLGYLLAASFVRNRAVKVVLAICWFFGQANYPHWQHLGHPYAEHATLILATIWLVQHSGRLQKPWVPALAMLCLTLSYWISELTLAALPAIALLWLNAHRHASNGTWLGGVKNLLRGLITFQAALTLLAAGVGIAFIAVAKSHAHTINDYGTLLASADQVAAMFAALWKASVQWLSFSRENPVLSVAMWVALGLIPLAALRIKTLLRSEHLLAPAAGLLLAGSAGAIAIAYWPNAFGPGLHYYTALLPWAWWLMALWVDAERNMFKRLAMGGFAVVALLGAGSGYWMKYVQLQRDAPYQAVKDIRKLGKAYLIGNYWNAYLLASVNPDELYATARQYSTVRRKAQAHWIASQPEVYLVADSWLDEWPKEIEQFGHVLTKEGEPFELAGCRICLYSSRPNVMVD